MADLLLKNEPFIRMAVFLGVLVTMAIWEMAAPRRRQEIPRLLRWTNNLALVVVDTILVRLTFPIVAVGLALLAEQRGWGFFNTFAVPGWLAVLASVIVLDLVIYLQHVIFHACQHSGGCTACIMPTSSSTSPPACDSIPSKFFSLWG